MGEQVGHHHRRLAAYGGGGLGVGHAAHIAQGEHVGVAHVLEVELIHLHEAGAVGQGAGGHRVGGGHRRGHVQQVVGDHLLAAGLSLAHLEHRFFPVGANGGEHVVVAGVDALALHHLPQGRRIGGDAEDARGGGGIDHLGVETLLLEHVVGQVGDLLGGAGALDRHRRAGEHGVAALERLDRLPGVRGEVLAVVAAHAALAQGFCEPLDLVPAELEAGGHDQHVVAEAVAGGGGDAVVIGIKAGGAGLDPVHPRGDQVPLGAAGLLQAEHPAAHQGPSGLVVVLAGGLEDRHVERRAGPLELGGHGDAGGSAADDQNLVVGHGMGRPGEGATAAPRLRLGCRLVSSDLGTPGACHQSFAAKISTAPAQTAGCSTSRLSRA